MNSQGEFLMVLGDHAIFDTVEHSLYFRAVSSALQDIGQRLVI